MMTPDDDNATQRGLDDSDDDGEDDGEEHAHFEAEEDMGEQVECEERVSNAGIKLPNLASIERDRKINKTRSPLWGSEGVLHKAVCLQKQRCAPALAPLPLAHALVTLFMFNSTHSSHLPPCPWHMPLSPCLCLTPLTPLTPLTLVHRFQFQLASSSFPASHSAIPSVPCSVVRACASFPTSRVPSSSI